MSTMSVAFLGLGVMGYPMAGHLRAAGHEVCVYNRTRPKAERWVEEHGGRSAASPAAAAAAAEVVFTCLGNDEDVRAVVLGQNGVLSTLGAGALLIDHTTTSAGLAREVAAKCSTAQVGFLDAPISGGQAGAESGRLTVMVGGEDTDYERARPLLECYSHMRELIGPAGSGQLCKMVNQICIAGLLQGLSEGLNFGEKSGLDMARVLSVIRKGAAQSWQMDQRAETMLAGDFDFGFAVDWMRKDLGYCLAEAKRNGAKTPITEAVNERFSQVQEAGGGRLDTSSLIKLL